MHPDKATVVAGADVGALAQGLTLIAALGSLPFRYDTAVMIGAIMIDDAKFLEPRGLTPGAGAAEVPA